MGSCFAFRALKKALPLWMGCVVLASGLAMAQTAAPWEPVAASERGQFYIDPTSIRRSGGITQFKTLLDYAQAQITYNGKAFRSALSRMEIDCKADQGRIVKITFHSGPMAAGTLVETQGQVQNWQSIDPESPVRRMAQRVCR